MFNDVGRILLFEYCFSKRKLLDTDAFRVYTDLACDEMDYYVSDVKPIAPARYHDLEIYNTRVMIFLWRKQNENIYG